MLRHDLTHHTHVCLPSLLSFFFVLHEEPLIGLEYWELLHVAEYVRLADDQDHVREDIENVVRDVEVGGAVGQGVGLHGELREEGATAELHQRGVIRCAPLWKDEDGWGLALLTEDLAFLDVLHDPFTLFMSPGTVDK